MLRNILMQIKKFSRFIVGFLSLLLVYLLNSTHQKQTPNALAEKEMIIVVPSYNNKDWFKKNLDSLINQDYKNYHIVYVDDCSPDGTGTLVENYMRDQKLEQKITLIKNKERKGALENLYNSIHAAPDNAIIITVDGDDWLKNEHVLARVNEEYQNPKTWMTYGQFEFYPSKRPGVCRPIAQSVIQNNNYKQSPWISSHLRTFYAWLFKSIKRDDLMYNGNFFAVSGDMAFMFPLLELAGEHHTFIKDVLYVYNEGNPLCDHAIRRPAQIEMDKVIRNIPANKPLSEADCLIFSYDRPLQLYALLESVQKYMNGFSQISVLYRTSTNEFENGYEKIKHNFPHVTFIKQGANPRADFKQLMLDTIYKSKNEYVLFAVDDIIVKDFVDLRRCIASMQQENAYGFYLRLGKNIAKYDEEPNQADIELTKVSEDVYSWTFNGSPTEWRYANTVDMTLYNKNAIKNDLLNLSYFAPNSFEAAWAARADQTKKGLCFAHSKMINIPINRVQNEYNNRSMNLYTAQELLEQFNKGFKINIAPLHQVANKYPHTEYKPEFIVR